MNDQPHARLSRLRLLAGFALLALAPALMLGLLLLDTPVRGAPPVVSLLAGVACFAGSIGSFGAAAMLIATSLHDACGECGGSLETFRTTFAADRYPEMAARVERDGPFALLQILDEPGDADEGASSIGAIDCHLCSSCRRSGTLVVHRLGSGVHGALEPIESCRARKLQGWTMQHVARLAEARGARSA